MNPEVLKAEEAPAHPAMRKPRELELDLLLGHELETGSAAARVLWQAVQRRVPSEVRVRYQVARSYDGRTTDVVADAGECTLLCEDKLAEGVEQPGQWDGLAGEVRASGGHLLAVVVAPSRFIERKGPQLAEFGLGAVSVEELAAALEAAMVNDQQPLDLELQRSYSYRARALRDLCRSIAPATSEPGVAFRDSYDAAVSAQSDGRVRLQVGTLTQGGGFAAFAAGRPLPPGMDVTHKLRDGLLDVTLHGWTLEAVKAFLDSLPTDALPAGWQPAVPRMARAKKGVRTPVLRHQAPKGPANISSMEVEVAASEGTEAAEGVGQILLEFTAWTEGPGHDLLHAPSVRILRDMLNAASATARNLRSDDLAGVIDALADQLEV